MSDQDPGQAPAVPRRKSLLHDLKTPLNQIIGYAEMLEEEAQDDGRTADVETLVKISKAGRRLSEMLEVAFDPARAQARVEAAAGQASGVAEAQKPGSEEPTARGVGRLLVVDDNEMNRDMLSRRLARKGFDVSLAVDGAEGVAKARAEKPDLILLDMSLPVLDGWEAARQLKGADDTRAIPIIALTAHAMAGDREKALEAGCDDYDTKPIELPRLLEKMAALLPKA